MNDLIVNNLIKEKKDTTNISYILEDNSLFFETGYKVLQNQEKNGFIKAVKVIHNGKIKLIYDISKYKSLSSIIPELTEQNFIIVLAKLFDILCETIDNGFMQIENININFENIFIDSNNLNLYLIYIPINIQSNSSSKVAFEERLKNNIFKVISSHLNMNSEVVDKLRSNISLGNSTIEVLRNNVKSLTNFNSSNFGNYNQVQNEKTRIKNEYINDTLIDFDQGRSDSLKRERKSQGNFIARIKGVFTHSDKKANIHERKREYSDVVVNRNSNIENQYEALETEVLSEEIFTPTIVLSGVKTPEVINIPITKEKFLIGKNKQMVDGVITFNKAISRIHCKILYKDGRYFLLDEKSANGTYVNNLRVPVNGQVQIKVGDVIKLANSEFIVKPI